MWPDDEADAPALDALALMRAAGLTPDPLQVKIATTPGHQLVLAHRQFGKSQIAAAIAREDAARYPGSLDLLVSRSMRQSGELFRKVKDFYQLTPGRMPLVKDTEHEMEWPNGSRTISLPASPETIVGYSSVHRLIIDEAARVPDETYYSVRPMLAMSGGTILAITSPFGRRGWFWEEWTGKAGDEHVMDLANVERLLADLDFPIDEYSERGQVVPTVSDDLRSYQWTKTYVPATHNPRLTRAFLASERWRIPDLWFRQEWLCEFVELSEVVFRYEDLRAMISKEVQPLYGADGEVLEDMRVVRGDVAPLELGGNVWTA